MNILSDAEALQTVTDKARSLSNIGDWSQTLLARAWSAVRWIMQRAQAQQARKNLRVCETVSLGEKRFVAVVQVDEERFLIGGSSGAVSLLTRLQEAKSFSVALERETGKIS
jgi:flagellar biogenesis protein FliO